MTDRLVDGATCMLDGFGIYNSVMAPRVHTNNANNSIAHYPLRPIITGTQVVVRLDGECFVFHDRRGRWDRVTSDAKTPLTQEQRAVLKVIDPARVVWIRVVEQIPGEPIMVAFDDGIGKAILAVGRIRWPASKRLGTSDHRGSHVSIVGVEWHPEGYEPVWLRPLS